MGAPAVNSLNTFAVALDEPPGREVAGVRQRESLQFFARQEFREGRGAARRFYGSRFRAGRPAGLVAVARHLVRCFTPTGQRYGPRLVKPTASLCVAHVRDAVKQNEGSWQLSCC